MKSRVISFALMLLMVFTMICGPVVTVNAEESKGLDAILVLDQSGSMKSNDPNGMMKTASNMLIEMMPSKTGRIGVISFNREQTKVAELTELEKIDSVEKMINAVAAIEYKGDTDIGNAVADAVEMFDLKDNREHVILVLSDGRNDFGIEKNEEKKSDERLNEALITAQSHNCQIFCLGFGKEMSNVDDTPYKKLVSIASAPNNVSTETDAGNIHNFFVSMLAKLLGTKIQPIYDNKITIEPNVKEANIYMSSIEDMSDATIELIGPDGKSKALENNDQIRFYKDKYSAVIKLFEPEPGIYTIKTSTDQIKVVSIGYIPSYEYVLSASVVDDMGNVIETVHNGAIGKITAVIQQDGKNITEAEVYEKVTAKAVVTAKDTGKETTVNMVYQGGELKGDVTFDHLATYDIHVTVETETFELEDDVLITTKQRPISFNNGIDAEQIEKKIINKTFKKSADLMVDNSELLSVISDPDNVGITIDQVSSSDEEKVLAQLTDDGLLLTGIKWGSSIIKVLYKDGLGNTIQTSFTAKVEDKLLVAFFTMLPVVIAACVGLVVFLIMRKSRMVKGDIEINKIELRRDEMITIVSERKSYKAGVFVGRKKTLGNGITKYAQDIYSLNGSLPQNQELFTLFANNQTAMRQNLDQVKFVGTYLGRNGCSVKIKKGSPVSMSNNREYGKAVKLVWPAKANFKVFTKDSTGTELCIDGTYSFQRPKRTAGNKAANRANNSIKTPGGQSCSGANTTGTTFSGGSSYKDVEDFFNS